MILASAAEIPLKNFFFILLTIVFHPSADSVRFVLSREWHLEHRFSKRALGSRVAEKAFPSRQVIKIKKKSIESVNLRHELMDILALLFNFLWMGSALDSPYRSIPIKTE